MSIEARVRNCVATWMPTAILVALVGSSPLTLFAAPLFAEDLVAKESRLASESQLASVVPLFNHFCSDCHAGPDAKGQIDLEQMVSEKSLDARFQDWRKVAHKLEQREMPPPDSPQPTTAQRAELVASVGAALRRVALQHASDPGQVVLRRLTSAEHAYTIQDLTGLDLDLGPDFGADAVGGEGFTNIGIVQFVQESTLEQYLKLAKQVADHAVVGAGPLQFFRDPGKTGFELSAITRIQTIYRDHGFRTSAGEGGEPFGLDFYPKAFFVAWRYQHREKLGLADVSIGELAADEQLSPRFAQHIWSVLSQSSPSFPTSEIVADWRNLPDPTDDRNVLEQQVRTKCDGLYETLQDWYRRLATANDEEAAPVLVEDAVHASRSETLKVRVIWPEESDTADVRWEVLAADGGPDENISVVWSNPRIRFMDLEQRWLAEQPLKNVIGSDSIDKLGFGRHPNGRAIDSDSFVTTGRQPSRMTLRLPSGGWNAEILVEARMDPDAAGDRVVRCGISAGELAAKGKMISALLADPSGDTFEAWSTRVLDFARNLPQVSHREPAPSDRDPIPAPFNNTYNMPERDRFHYKVKYFRDDKYLTEFILDDSQRASLDQAWADLLTSFEYHDVYLRFISKKFEFTWRPIEEVDKQWIDGLPALARTHVHRLHQEYAAARKLVDESRYRHIADVIHFASQAWRRPVNSDERHRLRQFYEAIRSEEALDHTAAIRAMLVRILVAPDFIYRAERPSDLADAMPLTQWELASRLSYFLWSSLPDAELKRAAEAGELSDSDELVRQARRMLRHPKSRRFATEFFGQWFGFYRFDRYRGVDSGRFPEFTENLKSAMYAEAITFFEHLVRKDRPVREILFADYTFLNHALSEHYGVDAKLAVGKPLQRVDDVGRFQRGGLFGLGAVLTVTSAPLRTSPVKRGDWVLRRVIGTPVPPPPADAGSIPADDVLTDGLTVRERLEAHRQQASCMNCHSRIDPLGFALEHYDAIGRWRDLYRGGKPIDASGVLEDGTQITGPDGLEQFLQANESLFRRTLCIKLAGYVLGRRESIVDQVLIGDMLASLEEDGRFSALVEKIVTSKQFRYHRGREQRVASNE